jgi:hypothetical protein
MDFIKLEIDRQSSPENPPDAQCVFGYFGFVEIGPPDCDDNLVCGNRYDNTPD